MLARLCRLAAQVRGAHSRHEHVPTTNGEDRHLDTATLIGLLSAHDPTTGEHVNGVACIAAEIALIEGLDEEAIEAVEIGARLHDIGKIGVPAAILTKRGPLNDEEWVQIKRHPSIGARVLREVPSLAPAAAAVEAHHERWDGTGYPRGLAGEEIPLESRIFALADSIDAMTSERPYKSAMSWEELRGELEGGSGTQWDPMLTQLVLMELDRIITLEHGCRHGVREVKVA